MKIIVMAFAVITLCGAGPTAGDDDLGFSQDYYLGFSQGAYYGLMLAGEDYHVAWCMKSELEYEAASLGTGGEFQEGIERLHEKCRSSATQN